MKRFSLLTLALLGFQLLHAQPGFRDGWTWPENDSLKSISMEKEAFYKVSMGLENWNDALRALQWLWVNNPNLHSAIYQNGVKVYEELLNRDLSDEQRLNYEDSLLIMYDLRMANFGDSANVMDRKAYSAFKMYYKRPEKFALLAELYDYAFELSGANISTYNLLPYITLAKYYHQSDPVEMPAERVLDIHNQVSLVIEAKVQSGEDPERLKNDQDKADAMLSSIPGILTCEFIASQLVPRLHENPEDLNTAKKIFTYSLKAKCTDEPYFLEAGEVIFQDNPVFELADALGDRYARSDNYDKAISYYKSGFELADEAEEKYESYMSLAVLYSKISNKPEAYRNALEALKIKPNDSPAYNLIGNLFFGSYDDCKLGESKVIDRAIFIAAYEMYKKAGNTEKMAETKAQFPSKEELFDENRSKGDEVSVKCWIRQTVKLDTRD